jgi:iron complex outermembrane receptor protein
VSATFALDYTKTDENGSPLVFAAINEAQAFPRVASFTAGCPGMTDVAPPPGLPDQNVPMIQSDLCANDFQSRGPYGNNGTYPLTSELEETGVAANIAVDLNDQWVFKSISSARNLDWAGNRDADNTPLRILHTLYDVDGSQWSQEFQLTMQSDALTGVVGFHYLQQDSEDIVTVELDSPAPGLQTDSDNNTVDNSSWAVFTQWTFALSERLDVTVGGRYTEETKRAYPDQYDFSTPTVKQVPVQWYEDTFSDFTPSASLAYRWSDAGMAYVSYAEGFKGGGWNSHWNAVLTPAQQAQIHPFRPEYAETFEVGLKLDLADNTLRLNGAVFSSDYTDMQITYRGPAPAGVAPFLTNAGKAGIDGAELEATWVPTDALILEASLGYLDSALDNLDNVPAGILPPGLVVGNALPFAPEEQAHFGIGYDARPGNLVLTPRIDVSYTGEMFFDAINTPEIAQLESVTVVNVSLALAPSAGNWRFILGVNNATDELYPIGGNSSLTSGAGYAEIAYARPREYFATFSYDF